MSAENQPLGKGDKFWHRFSTTWRMIFNRHYRRTTLRNLSVGRFIPPDVYDYWNWVRTAGTSEGIPVYDGNQFQREAGNDKPLERYKQWYASRTSTTDRCGLDLDRWYPPKLEGWSGLVWLSIRVRGKTAMEIVDRKLLTLVIGDFNQELVIRNCFIERLQLQSNNLVLRIENSVIGRIVWSAVTVTSLDMNNVAIMDVKVENKPSGVILVKRIWLARDPRDGAGSIHHLRAFRGYLSTENNAAAAGIFHSAELALERRYEARRWTKFVSWIYEFFSDYGNSIAKPLMWFWVIYSIMFVLALIFDALDADVGRGWQKHLDGARLLKATVYPFLAIFNPLGVFGKSLILADHWGWSFVFTILALIGTMCVAFLLIGIRRRFKLE